ncbi:MAG: sialate O-acetylesterase [Verrucomicrobiae bacterium]|nr:sialate O-acetylesterase [Verrucomicrobiae bacterium]NNJ43857.1 hypothetical protein [Akkermansiaceae bacterium]
MRNPLMTSFRKCVEAVLGQDKVLVVSYAKPSQPIKNWYRKWQAPEGMEAPDPAKRGHTYDTLEKKLGKLIQGKRIASVTYIWMQGEADAGKGWGKVYKKSFLGVLDQLKAFLKIDSINFVVGRINEYWLDQPDGELMRKILVELGEDHPNGDWINTDDLNRGVNPWGGFSYEDGHFPPSGYRVMGQRFAKKACQLVQPDVNLNHPVFTEVFFDSANQISTHVAIGKGVSGSVPDPKHQGEKAGLARLTDGKFGTKSHSDPNWIGFAPSKATLELIVDLGEVVSLESVAVNTLVSTEARAEFPDRITFSKSIDRTDYSGHGNRYHNITANEGRGKLRLPGKESIGPDALLLLNDMNGAKARYIKVEIQTGSQWVFIDEIIVNPKGK